MQAPRHSIRMRVGRCMQRRRWGGEKERNEWRSVGERGNGERLWPSPKFRAGELI